MELFLAMWHYFCQKATTLNTLYMVIKAQSTLVMKREQNKQTPSFVGIQPNGTNLIWVESFIS